MPKFVCSMSYELDPSAAEEAKKLLRAELVGRRWRDRAGDRPLPRNTVWIFRSAGDDETADQVHDACTRDLKTAADAVRSAGLPVKVLRAWIHVSGGGTYGLAAGEIFSPEE